MFEIYSDGVLIGFSAFEHGDPPMGIAFGVFEPSARFSEIRFEALTVSDATGGKRSDRRVWHGTARASDGAEFKCHVTEYGPIEAPLGIEVSCLGIPHPLYERLFPAHEAAYRKEYPSA